MAGLLMDAAGRVLLAERPAGKHLAGYWEFPGGKVESGERPLAALARELHEELGIELQSAEPLIRVPWTYDDRRLVLDAWRVDRWQGTPQSLEGQALQWCHPMAIDPQRMTPADRPILHALRLPATYVITPENWALDQYDELRQRIDEAMRGGVRLLQLRLPLWPVEAVRKLAVDLLPVARKHDAQLMLHGDIEGAQALGIGAHLNQDQWLSAAERPLPWQQLVGVSCHDALQLARATQIRADFATLRLGGAPAAGSQNVTQAAWSSFHSLAEQASLPVYATGDISSLLLASAKQNGAQGVVLTKEWTI